MHDFAVKLIKEGLAYVCQLSPEEMREYRGTLTTPGKDSPYRNRDIEDNIRMFQEMKGRYL
jgi:glutaminyl-tRNA synthetase